MKNWILTAARAINIFTYLLPLPREKRLLWMNFKFCVKFLHYWPNKSHNSPSNPTLFLLHLHFLLHQYNVLQIEKSQKDHYTQLLRSSVLYWGSFIIICFFFLNQILGPHPVTSLAEVLLRKKVQTLRNNSCEANSWLLLPWKYC